MLDIAATRCPEAQFTCRDIGNFQVSDPQDLITCFYIRFTTATELEKLEAYIESAHSALMSGGVFCFNAVDKDKIDNNLFVRHTVKKADDAFTFRSGWHYRYVKTALKLHIPKTNACDTRVWNDEHPMVAVSFAELITPASSPTLKCMYSTQLEAIAPVNTYLGTHFCLREDSPPHGCSNGAIHLLLISSHSTHLLSKRRLQSAA